MYIWLLAYSSCLYTSSSPDLLTSSCYVSLLFWRITFRALFLNGIVAGEDRIVSLLLSGFLGGGPSYDYTCLRLMVVRAGGRPGTILIVSFLEARGLETLFWFISVVLACWTVLTADFSVSFFWGTGSTYLFSAIVFYFDSDLVADFRASITFCYFVICDLSGNCAGLSRNTLTKSKPIAWEVLSLDCMSSSACKRLITEG